MQNQYLKDELQGLVPVQIADNIFQSIARGSTVLKLADTEEMTSDTLKMPIMTGGTGAFWTKEAGRIQTSTATWETPTLSAEKLAVIVPVTREKLADTTINVFDALTPKIAEAFYKEIDKAVLFGSSTSPFGVGKSIFELISTNHRTNTMSKSDRMDNVLSDTMSLVESSNHDVNGFIAGVSLKNDLRKLRDANGNPLYVANGEDGATLYGQPIEFARNGAWDNTKAIAIAGDFSNCVIGIRAGIEYETLTEATLTSVTMADGKPLSLAENDMIALKATMRLGFAVVKPEAFSALIPASEGRKAS